MNTYAIIDTHSGYVWGVETASDPIAACRALDESIGGVQRTYETGTVSDIAGGAYDVRIAPPGYVAEDGQDAATIEQAETMPRAAIIIWAL
jgi:hypothetical protein